MDNSVVSVGGKGGIRGLKGNEKTIKYSKKFKNIKEYAVLYKILWNKSY